MDEKALKEWGYTVWGDETEEEKKLMMFEKGLVKAVSVVDARAARWNGEIIAKSPIWKEMDGITYFPRRLVRMNNVPFRGAGVKWRTTVGN